MQIFLKLFQLAFVVVYSPYFVVCRQLQCVLSECLDPLLLVQLTCVSLMHKLCYNATGNISQSAYNSLAPTRSDNNNNAIIQTQWLIVNA